MKKILLLLLVVGAAVVSVRCGRQVSQAKALGDCKFNILGTDSVYLGGVDVRKFRDLRDPRELTRYPQLALGVLRQNVPLDANLLLDITNPGTRLAAINQLEYRILLRDVELANGFINRRLEVQPNGGRTQVPVHIRTNAYQLVTDDRSRDAFIELVQNLSGQANVAPAMVTIKVKPQGFPTFLTFEQPVTNKTFSGL
jgi:hypothetical protein